MKRNQRIFLAAALAALAAAAAGCSNEGEGVRYSRGEGWPSPAGPFLGQEPPGREAELFAPGIITRGFHEISMTFTRDMDGFWFITADRAYSFYVVIGCSSSEGVWRPPEPMSFSGRFRDLSVSLKPDGSGLLLSSDRPSDHLFDIWEVPREGEGWGEPSLLFDGLEGYEGGSCASASAGGDVYYQSMDNDIYVVRREAGRYLPPERIPEPVSTGAHEGRPFIAPDGSYLLFNSNRSGGFGESDIYVSFAGPSGWGEPKNLGAGVNSSSGDFAASVTPDGKYIFFSSYRTFGPEDFIGRGYDGIIEMLSSPQNGYAALYWVKADILQVLAKE